MQQPVSTSSAVTLDRPAARTTDRVDDFGVDTIEQAAGRCPEDAVGAGDLDLDREPEISRMPRWVGLSLVLGFSLAAWAGVIWAVMTLV